MSTVLEALNKTKKHDAGLLGVSWVSQEVAKADATSLLGLDPTCLDALQAVLWFSAQDEKRFGLAGGGK